MNIKQCDRVSALGFKITILSRCFGRHDNILNWDKTKYVVIIHFTHLIHDSLVPKQVEHAL